MRLSSENRSQTLSAGQKSAPHGLRSVQTSGI